MNTKTMHLPPRRVVTPGASNKRKERDGFDALKPSTPKTPPKPQAAGLEPHPKAPEPAPSNRLLAGYLAHEFLTKGTLFGQPWDAARADSGPSSKRAKPSEGADEGEPRGRAEPPSEKHQRYVELACLLKTDGAHLAGIVNPTQLARYMQM